MMKNQYTHKGFDFFRTLDLLPTTAEMLSDFNFPIEQVLLHSGAYTNP